MAQYLRAPRSTTARLRSRPNETCARLREGKKAETSMQNGETNMAPRAIWTGCIRFGGVSVPVGLYPAERSHRRIDDPGQLDAVEPASGHVIEVLDFVREDRIDLRFYDFSHRLGPHGDDRKYAALATALQKMQRVGVCQWTVGGKSYLGVLTGAGGILSLFTLRRKNGARHADPLILSQAALDERELSAAKRLIETLSARFGPAQRRDERDDRSCTSIDCGVSGEPITLPPLRSPLPTDLEGLLTALDIGLEPVGTRR